MDGWMDGWLVVVVAFCFEGGFKVEMFDVAPAASVLPPTLPTLEWCTSCHYSACHSRIDHVCWHVV